jgi:uncharacterized protein
LAGGSFCTAPQQVAKTLYPEGDSPMPSIPRRVCEKLQFYVYLYVDPRTQRPFYVGKGQGNRIYSHLEDTEDCEKVKRIAELGKLGLEPILEILKYGLTEREAFLVESAAIELLGIDELTNRVKGHGAMDNGRARLSEIIQELDAEEITIKDKAILINISRLYRYGMTAMELYDTTRGVWKVAPERHAAEFAFSVYGGIVREVYSIAAWVPADSTLMTGRDVGQEPSDVGLDDGGKERNLSQRREFVGKVAPAPVRKKYVGKSVRRYFSAGSQNPIKYVNC